jgi:DNA polymerase III, gamma and tau subunit
MFNEDLKKEVQGVLKEKYEDYRITIENTVKHSEALYQKKLEAIKILGKMSKYIENLANKPKEYETIAGKIELNIRNFDDKINKIEKEIKEINGVPTAIAGAGTLAGAGISAFAPTAAMGIATTFGTASTGVAISTLSGAAATNAALAWLGGGALAAGGAGMAAGETLLALAGPIGWTIGGVALAGSGLLLNIKNKEAAEKMEEQIVEIKKETMNVMKIDIKVLFSEKEITEASYKIENELEKFYNKQDYNYFTNIEKENFIVLMNTSEALSKKIGEIITNE